MGFFVDYQMRYGPKHDFLEVYAKVKVIGKKINGNTGFLDLKNIYLDKKIVMLFALVLKLWSKTSLTQNGWIT